MQEKVIVQFDVEPILYLYFQGKSWPKNTIFQKNSLPITLYPIGVLGSVSVILVKCLSWLLWKREEDNWQMKGFFIITKCILVLMISTAQTEINAVRVLVFFPRTSMKFIIWINYVSKFWKIARVIKDLKYKELESTCCAGIS